MGLLTATFGTIVGFIFAYAIVRCNIPGKDHHVKHFAAVSPPVALSLSTILLYFGRSGLIAGTAGDEYGWGMNGASTAWMDWCWCNHHILLRCLPRSSAAMLERFDLRWRKPRQPAGSDFLLVVTLPLRTLIPGLA